MPGLIQLERMVPEGDLLTN